MTTSFPKMDIRFPITLWAILTVNRLVLKEVLTIYALVTYPKTNCTRTKNDNTKESAI